MGSLYNRIPKLTSQEIERFWGRVDKTPGLGRGDCWLWRGAAIKGGYGGVKFRGHMFLVHRVAFFLQNETIDGTLVVRHGHLCPKLCVRHLEQGTHQENMADEMSRGLTCKGDRWKAAHSNQAKGERIGNSKLTEPIVREMREVYIPRTFGYAKVAQLVETKYGIKIDPSLVHLIVKRKWWAWVD